MYPERETFKPFKYTGLKRVETLFYHWNASVTIPLTFDMAGTSYDIMKLTEWYIFNQTCF